jgi:hypothetical protein
MRSLLALFGLAVLLFVIVGYFSGWYTVKGNKAELHPSVIEKDIESYRK